MVDRRKFKGRKGCASFRPFICDKMIWKLAAPHLNFVRELGLFRNASKNPA